MTSPETSATASPDDAAREPVSLIQRTVRTLELLAAEPLTAADVARALDVNRSTTLRLLSELVATGYVTRDPASKRFTTVPAKFLSLASSREPHADWSQVIDPILASVRDECGDSTLLGVPANDSMVYLAFFPTVHVVAVSEQLGTVRPMHCSGMGKAYLSALEPSVLDAELGRLSYRGGTERAARGPIELRRRVEEARDRGYALDCDETFDGVRCVATPVRIHGTLIGAAGISGPASRLPEARLHELGPYLIQKFSVL